MARSTQVYVVTDGATPLAGFTVKYELEHYLFMHGWFRGDVPWEVYRIRDGYLLSDKERTVTRMLSKDFT